MQIWAFHNRLCYVFFLDWYYWLSHDFVIFSQVNRSIPIGELFSSISTSCHVERLQLQWCNISSGLQSSERRSISNVNLPSMYLPLQIHLSTYSSHRSCKTYKLCLLYEQIFCAINILITDASKIFLSRSMQHHREKEQDLADPAIMLFETTPYLGLLHRKAQTTVLQSMGYLLLRDATHLFLHKLVHSVNVRMPCNNLRVVQLNGRRGRSSAYRRHDCSRVHHLKMDRIQVIQLFHKMFLSISVSEIQVLTGSQRNL